MRILVCNDDGIYSPGLVALAGVAAKFGEVRIVAPDIEQSSKSHAITSSRPLLYRRTPQVKFDAWRVNGTPADCVSLGVYHWEKVDLVVSGINLGTNLGNAVWPSGTLAAAKQAALLGIRGIAFSTPVHDTEPDFATLVPWVERTLEQLLPEKELPLVNVNIPAQPLGFCWTKLSFRHYDGRVVPQKDPMGRQQYWITVIPVEGIEEGTDRWAMQRNHVSMTPLMLDITDSNELSRIRSREGGATRLVTKSTDGARMAVGDVPVSTPLNHDHEVVGEE
ncbi:MAG TPA: 5'/3'-nucleotidase SurE [Candidatus Didemnitutus sp.]|nr:5'/3'-nucleotidase SurE [Candidatus Didemnitutus sp.]